MLLAREAKKVSKSKTKVHQATRNKGHVPVASVGPATTTSTVATTTTTTVGQVNGSTGESGLPQLVPPPPQQEVTGIVMTIYVYPYHLIKFPRLCFFLCLLERRGQQQKSDSIEHLPSITWLSHDTIHSDFNPSIHENNHQQCYM